MTYTDITYKMDRSDMSKSKMRENQQQQWKGLCRVKFLARLPAIRAALQEGWTVKHVYDQHAVGEAMSYRQFARYIARLPETEASLKPVRTASVRTRRSKLPAPAGESAGLRQFSYDPAFLFPIT
jgi:hypothetical protein